MRPRMVRSPVDICLGTSPIQAEKSRPLANAAPLPIAAIIALEMIGPMPGTLMILRQLLSLLAKPRSRRSQVQFVHRAAASHWQDQLRCAPCVVTEHPSAWPGCRAAPGEGSAVLVER